MYSQLINAIIIKNIEKVGNIMLDKNKKTEENIKKILRAMSITVRDVKDSWQKEISEYSSNGLFQSVWAKRCDSLIRDFSSDEGVKVLHFKRGIWQVDSVFDKETGTLYLLFNSKTLDSIKKQYFKGESNHYSVSLLLKNEGLLIEHEEQLELFPIDDESQRNFKIREINKMLGNNAENVKSVVMVNVEYHSEAAIEAKLELYSPTFELLNYYDVTDLLPNRYNMEEIVGNMPKLQVKLPESDSIVEMPIVKLKDTLKENNTSI